MDPTRSSAPYNRPPRQRSHQPRKTIDYNNSCTQYLLNRIYGINGNERNIYTEPTLDYVRTQSTIHNINHQYNHIPSGGSTVHTRYLQQTNNITKSAQQCSVWINTGNRLLVGTQTGEFCLWNGITLQLDSMLSAHEHPIRSVIWSSNDQWLVSGDDNGIIKYWQSSMNNVKAFQAHNEPIRELTFSQTTQKYASGSDDQSICIWDFELASKDNTLRGHGYDVKCLQWHPYKALLASGSKDTTIKLWDPRLSGMGNITTIYTHKNTVSCLAWNSNGYYLASGGRDQLIKIIDIRMMNELHTYKAHKKEVTSLAWHPFNEQLLTSGSYEGTYRTDNRYMVMYGNAGDIYTNIVYHLYDVLSKQVPCTTGILIRINI